MTSPREWPNNAKEARDRAAEETAKALKFTLALAQNGGTLTADDKAKLISMIIYHLQNTLRWLESAGAQTRPS